MAPRASIPYRLAEITMFFRARKAFSFSMSYLEKDCPEEAELLFSPLYGMGPRLSTDVIFATRLQKGKVIHDILLTICYSK
jgi:hypothetical protein